MNEQLLEPLRFYKSRGKDLFKQNATDYFDRLHKESGVNADENRATVKEYNKEMAAAETVKKKIQGKRTAKGLLIALIVIASIVALFGVFSAVGGDIATGLLMIAGGAAAIVLSALLIAKKLNPAIKKADEILQKHLDKAGELLNLAREQMAPLNALFTNEDSLRLIEQTVPELKFDERYTVENHRLFVEKHDFIELSDNECSTLDTLSGNFAGNPFLFTRRLIHEMRSETYHGTLTISWTETYRDSKGNLRTRRRTQTLHASVVKPKPYFYKSNHLIYGNQAAPDLSFSRDPQHSERFEKKELERRVKKGAKELKKLSEKATEEGRSFQEMANTEFEVLFGATNRDHEVQFRLMYTPLAQINTVDLLTSKDGYGDDFKFTKKRRFNIITSEHAQRWTPDCSASNYYSHDIDEAKRKFISFNESYFKSVFFDFAPLLSVPAYVEEPCSSLEEYDGYQSYYTQYEHEVMANAIGYNRFVHPLSETEAILKTDIIKKQADGDKVAVTAFSYSTEPRIDYVPVMGGDGHIHNVPVPWTEYIPRQNISDIFISSAPLKKNNADRSSTPSADETLAYLHGLAAKLL